jgi:hypothetical protein
MERKSGGKFFITIQAVSPHAKTPSPQSPSSCLKPQPGVPDCRVASKFQTNSGALVCGVQPSRGALPKGYWRYGPKKPPRNQHLLRRRLFSVFLFCSAIQSRPQRVLSCDTSQRRPGHLYYRGDLHDLGVPGVLIGTCGAVFCC